jgi:hypothetical protein
VENTYLKSAKRELGGLSQDVSRLSQSLARSAFTTELFLA